MLSARHLLVGSALLAAVAPGRARACDDPDNLVDGCGFDAGASGWVATAGTLTWTPNGGSPDGHLRLTGAGPVDAVSPCIEAPERLDLELRHRVQTAIAATCTARVVEYADASCTAPLVEQVGQGRAGQGDFQWQWSTDHLDAVPPTTTHVRFGLGCTRSDGQPNDAGIDEVELSARLPRITVEIVGQGVIRNVGQPIIDCDETCTVRVLSGISLALEGQGAEGWVLGGVTGDPGCDDLYLDFVTKNLACVATFLPDADGDEAPDADDNCQGVPNPAQGNLDGDAYGDACDPDADNDTVINIFDNCPRDANLDQLDADADGLGDVCDPAPDRLDDWDEDGHTNDDDNCPFHANPDQADNDHDGLGNVCDEHNDLDVDRDGVLNLDDNCPFHANGDQIDSDFDGTGDACDGTDNLDPDGDGLQVAIDNCPFVGNPDQTDADVDGIGDACDPTNNDDVDGDEFLNAEDNCPFVFNPPQGDSDEDGIGNECDDSLNTDPDADGLDNAVDNCPFVVNASQADQDGDGLGDACDAFLGCSHGVGGGSWASLLALLALRRGGGSGRRNTPSPRG